jgi:hypothetical protein
MDWKFWRKDKGLVEFQSRRESKLGKPKELPQEVGLHLVVEQGLDPDWVWSLKCVRKRRSEKEDIFYVRIFRMDTVAQKGIQVTGYSSLDDHLDVILFAGWYEKNSRKVALEPIHREAV